jgi:hypothetical protein
MRRSQLLSAGFCVPADFVATLSTLPPEAGTDDTTASGAGPASLVTSDGWDEAVGAVGAARAAGAVRATGAATGGDQSKAGSTRKGSNVETSRRDDGNDDVTGACCWATGPGACDCTALTGSGAEGKGSGCFAICRAGATGAA